MSSDLIIADKITGERLHGLPDQWVGARVVGWMFNETSGRWWIAAYLTGGELKTASSSEAYTPSMFMQDFALRVLKHVNRHCSFGGVWLAGFMDKDMEEEFYLLWKDKDGDIQVPIEFPFAFHQLIGWKLDSFCIQATEAYSIWAEWHANMEYGKSQQVKLAQGEKPSFVSRG